jgi:hypothetical protein
MKSDVAQVEANFTIRTFAATEKISESLVWRLLRTGELDAIKIGRLTRITPEAHAAWKARLPARIPSKATA